MNHGGRLDDMDEVLTREQRDAIQQLLQEEGPIGDMIRQVLSSSSLAAAAATTVNPRDEGLALLLDDGTL